MNHSIMKNAFLINTKLPQMATAYMLFLLILQAPAEKENLPIMSNLFHSSQLIVLHESMGTTKAKNKVILNASKRIGIQDF